METILENQIELENNIRTQKPNRIVIAEIEYDNDTTGEIQTAINEEIDFEIIVSSLSNGLMRQHNISSVKFSVCEVLNGVVTPFISYDRRYYNFNERIEATNKGYLYYLKNRLCDNNQSSLLNKFKKKTTSIVWLSDENAVDPSELKKEEINA